MGWEMDPHRIAIMQCICTYVRGFQVGPATFARLELNKLQEKTETETNKDDVCSCNGSKAEMAKVRTVQEDNRSQHNTIMNDATKAKQGCTHVQGNVP